MNDDTQGLSGTILIVLISALTFSYNFVVSVTLNEISEYIEKECLLLSLRPVRIAGKYTKDEFYDWNPPKKLYVLLNIYIGIAYC